MKPEAAPPRPVDALVADLRRALTAAADPARAGAMAAYMKHIAPYLGVAAPVRRTASRDIRAEALRLDEQDVLEFCAACFAEPEREFHYVAVDVLEKRAATLTEGALPALRSLVETRSWWDTVDPLSKVVGSGVVRFVSWRDEMEAWAVDPDFWIRRIALLHQLGRGAETDTDRLFRFILANAGDREFFIRKAIGWALRDLAWKQPAVVEAFVDRYRPVLSPLSVREATKNLGRRRGDRPGSG